MNYQTLFKLFKNIGIVKILKLNESGNKEMEHSPKHIAIIMDGNGRWAQSRSLPRTAGHKAGMEAIKELVIVSEEIGVKSLTLFAFSTENWARPQEEVSYLMRLPSIFIKRELRSLIKRGIRIRRIGFDENVPMSTLKAIDDAVEQTKSNTGLTLNFAFNYGGRAEIVNAARNIAEQCLKGNVLAAEINEELFSKHLLTEGLPDVDLLIRTSGELRISNFLLWQIAYSEMIFTDTYFPDFKREAFLDTIAEYHKRNRRFGRIPTKTK